MSLRKYDREIIPHDNGKVYNGNTIYGEARVQQGDIYNVTHNHGQFRTNNDDRDKLKQQSLIESLKFDRMGARLRNVGTALPKTCQWLFHNVHFKDWIDDGNTIHHHGFLWIKGKPGSGKSTIMKAALDWARKNWRKQSILSYFFNGRAPGHLEKSSLGLYRSIVHQILTTLPDTKFEFFSRFYDKEQDGVVEEWDAIELQEFLIDVIKMPSIKRINLFVDALDEGQEHDVREMVAFFDDLCLHSLSNGAKLRICLSSRHYPHISCKKGLSLVVEDQREHDQDIKHYVRTKLHGNDDPQIHQLRQLICRKSEGIFLWVVLVVPMINETYDRGTLAAAEEHLARIPAKLDTLFEEILAKSDEGLGDCVCLLQWTLFSMRPLSPAELYLAVHYSPNSSIQGDVSVPNNKVLTRYLLHYSRGLIEQTTSSPPTVQFVHETVRDFLLKRNGIAHIAPFLSQNIEGPSHEKLKNGCFEYFKQSISKAMEEDGNGGYKKYSSAEQTSLLLRWNSQLPFLQYAVNMLFQHAEMAQRHRISQHQFLARITDKHHRYFAKWVNLNNCFKRRSRQMYSWNASPVYIFSEQNLISLIQRLIDQGIDVNEKGERYGNALQAACVAGHEDVVCLLLDRGANINARGGKHNNAFLAAIHMGRFPIARLLHNKGASPRRKDLSKAFLSVTTEAALESWNFLLQAGANINYAGPDGTALIRAALYGDLPLFLWLLNKGANVNVRGGLYGTALNAAILGSWNLVNRRIRIKQESVANGDNKGKKRNSSTPPEDIIVRLLAENGAEMEIGNGVFGNALFAACYCGYLPHVQYLLEQGANVNSSAKKTGITALHLASWFGHEQVVQILLERGVEINAKATFPSYDTRTHDMFRFLFQRAGPGHGSKTGQRLLYDGPDSDAYTLSMSSSLKYLDRWTALQMASYRGHQSVVQLLINKGADVNARGTFRSQADPDRQTLTTALQIAREQHHIEIVRILENNGAITLSNGNWGKDNAPGAFETTQSMSMSSPLSTLSKQDSVTEAIYPNIERLFKQGCEAQNSPQTGTGP